MLLSDVLFSRTTSAIFLCLLKQVLDPSIQKLFHNWSKLKVSHSMVNNVY